MGNTLNIRDLSTTHSRKFYIVAIYILLTLTLLTPVISYFSTFIDNHKTMILLTIFSLSVLFLLEYLKLIELKIDGMRSPKGNSEIYESTMANYSEIENEISKSRKCSIEVIANSLNTIWNTILKQSLSQVDMGKLDSLELTIVKRCENLQKNSDPIIKSIEEYFKSYITKKEKINVYTYESDIYFTGICINNAFLKYRLRNIEDKTDVMTTCFKDNSKVENFTINWFRSVLTDLKSKCECVFDSKSEKNRIYND